MKISMLKILEYQKNIKKIGSKNKVRVRLWNKWKNMKNINTYLKRESMKLEILYNT